MKIIILLFFLLGCSDNSGSDQKSSFTHNLIEKYGVPGMAAGIYIENEFTEIQTKGVRKAGSDAPLETYDTFHLGSCTKAMTSTLAAILIEEGLLDWTTPLSELLPDIEIHSQFLNMSFETLLVHRAGLPAEHNVFFKLWDMNPVEGRNLVTQTMLKEAPLSTPDKKYNYSNYGYIIAGHILEKLAGKSWEDLITQYLFNRLGMTTCGFGVTENNWGHLKVKGVAVPKNMDNPSAMGPSSTVHCSLQDWGKFLAVHLEGFNGSDKFLKRESFKKLHSVHPSKDSEYTYGGWFLLNRNWAQGPVLTHAGSNTLNYAVIWLAPNINTFTVAAANIGGDDGFHATDDYIRQLISKWLY